MSSAVWMPAMPPPMTSARFVTGLVIAVRGALSCTFAMAARPRMMAFAVASSRFLWIQEHCSRMFAISTI